jgi:hypothetical protein
LKIFDALIFFNMSKAMMPLREKLDQPVNHDPDQVSEIKASTDSTNQPINQYTPIDEKEHQEIDRKAGLNSARVFLYQGEEECNKNMETFINCIDAVKGSTGGTGFSAIKITALGRPEILVRAKDMALQCFTLTFNCIICTSGVDNSACCTALSRSDSPSAWRRRGATTNRSPARREW